MSHEQLKVCFSVLLNGKFYSEREILSHLNEMKRIPKSGFDYWTMEGAISIVHNGKELLGQEFWDSINLIYAQTQDLVEGIPRKEFLAYQSCWLSLQPQGTQLIYELKSVAESRPIQIKRSIPLNLFVREWSLMKFRMYKFADYLEFPPAKVILEGWRDRKTSTPKWRQVVGEDAIDFIVNSSIEEVLLNSTCGLSFVNLV